MEELILLTDYKSSFGSKFNATPPYSGLDLVCFTTEMEKFGYKIIPTHFFEIDFANPRVYSSKKVLYQSSEANDNFSEYKSFIDDVLYFLVLSGAELIPKYQYFKAHSNKVFMEMLRGFYTNSVDSKLYGTFEELKLDKVDYHFPLIIKKSHGAQSKGVFKANNANELIRIVKNISKSTYSIKSLVKEKLRSIKYKTYTPFSFNRNKFIIQPMIKNLTGDYKVLIFGDLIYVVKRDNPPNDFRASGGGYNTFTGDFEIPDGILNYAMNLFCDFNCPYISLDIANNEEGFHLIEFQFINFGTSGHLKSKKYFKKENTEYVLNDNNLTIEYLYAYSLNFYFLNNN